MKWWVRYFLAEFWYGVKLFSPLFVAAVILVMLDRINWI